LTNFLSIFQTKPSLCHLFAGYQLAFPATVQISAVSVSIYKFQKLKISEKVFLLKKEFFFETIEVNAKEIGMSS
jgi:hypothetical protein